MTRRVDESGWQQPEDEDLHVDDNFVDAVIGLSTDQDTLSNVSDAKCINDYMRALNDAELDDRRAFFMDRWTWDSAHPMDRHIADLLEHERKRRGDQRAVMMNALGV